MNPRFFSIPGGSGTSGREEPIECRLCPHRCILAPGGTGKCGGRLNRGGKPELPFYGLISAAALDPIEKKPLYHFRPGSEIFSLGFTGCNLRCPFCQNWHISQNPARSGRFCSPAEIITSALNAAESAQTAGGLQNGQIAYTYSEPLVHIEFLLDCMKEARKAGIANVLVTNGCVNAEAAAEILELCDAVNIDLKCFSEETYRKVLGGDLSTVLGFIRGAAEKKVHMELTTLVVPGLNDSPAELGRCRDFIADLQTGGIDVPWHLSAYHPAWKWSAPTTESDALISAAIQAREKLKYVYSGNAAFPENFNDTLCGDCGNVLIRRRGFRVNTSGLSLKKENGTLSYFCAFCGKAAPVR